jgi:hypothetical protein
MKVRLIIGGKAEAQALSEQDPGVLVVATYRYARTDGRGWRVSRVVAFNGRSALIGEQQLAVLVLLGVHGSATSRDMKDAISEWREGGGPLTPWVRLSQMRASMRSKLLWLGLGFDEFFDVDPQRRRYRIRRIENVCRNPKRPLDNLSHAII